MDIGKFVCVDGPNGSGKSSIIAELSTLLDKASLDFILTKEPTSSKLGKFIRREQDDFAGITLACLVAADRYDHLEKIIKPNLEEGKIVITDRYFPSSLVYQVLDGLDPNFIWELNRNIVMPDLFIYVAAQPKTIADRLLSRKITTRFENLDLDREVSFYENVFQVLGKKGFNILKVQNDQIPIKENVMIVYEAVLRIYGKI